MSDVFKQKIKVLEHIRELRRTNGFSLEGFQQQVVDVQDPRDRQKTAGQICDRISAECNVGREEILKLLPLCFAKSDLTFTWETQLNLGSIDLEKIRNTIDTLNTI